MSKKIRTKWLFFRRRHRAPLPEDAVARTYWPLHDTRPYCGDGDLGGYRGRFLPPFSSFRLVDSGRRCRARSGRDRLGVGSSAAEKRVALSGYDPVSYFTDGRPEKGSAEYSAAFDDATYWFKSAEHRALFVADPDHYAPQFAGYCAINVSRGVKQEADPEAWAIADGKLYVFSAKQGGPIFQQQTAAIVDKATENWPALRQHP